jgi:hypothetical protein
MTQTSRWLTALVMMVVVVSAGSIVSAGQAAKVDVTGAWVFTVESAAGKSNPTVTFTQTGEKLTGHYSSQLMGETELSGTVKGQAIEFAISANVQGAQVALTYSGTVESKDSMKGTLSAGDLGGGTFTAARK